MLDTGVLGNVIGVLKVNARDHDIARCCFSALADAASHADVAAALSSTAAVRLAQDWIDDNADDPDPDTMRSALKLLTALSSSDEVCSGLLETGVVDLIKGVLTKCCIDHENKEILSATVALVNGLSRSPQAVEQLATQGGLRRVMRAVKAKK